ncbi:VUT family protein [Legionella maioricensis]|uniref:VUT family protein n=1 Tax=Legionella maioricensis TaxID=2896528 RepID=A0A9X2CYB2_9GAMM|nr:VUT family protein [Legionella maioricensis]MCL9682981.1 VUT family protein [Legionella maioricensis]MCL9686329.1 VUT family protein [Legionella maioricensis]
MNQSLSLQQSSRFLFATVSMITCLILLINVSFKIIILRGLIFAVSSLLCPLIAGLYLLTLRKCTFKEQRHVLNVSLMTLYTFCIGVYVLVNLPAAEYMLDNPVYQIIFEDIPKKFFATTISFMLSFYLPHLLFCTKSNRVLSSPKQCMLLALLGGLSFFAIDFFLLFSDPHAHSFKQIFFDSLMVASLVLLIIGLSYLSFLLSNKQHKQVALKLNPGDDVFPLYHYLICFAVAVMLICIACEYRIVAFSKDGILAASCIFFPFTMIISSLIGELWGYHANLKLALVLIGAQFIFDAFLMGIVAFPSPPFFNLNPFYNYIVPRRLPAASLSLFVTFISNAMLLHYLKHSKCKLHRSLRILIANICASSLLCLVDYSLLFGGIYPYDQIINLVANVWQYKLLMTLISLPLILWLCKYLQENNIRVLQIKV